MARAPCRRMLHPCIDPTALSKIWWSCPVQAMQSTRNTLMDTYEYVMYGRIFKNVDAGGNSAQVCFAVNTHIRSPACLGIWYAYV